MPAEPISTPSPEPPRARADALISALAERMGARFSASSVFGDPVDREGVTVIPVAVVRFGLGGGSGSQPDKGQDGEGGGGGGAVSAVGHIEVKDGRSRFVPVVHPARMFGLMLVGILTGLLILRPAARQGRKRPPARQGRKRPPWR